MATWLVITIIPTSSVAHAASTPDSYEVYSNWRNSYQIAYPPTLVPQGESDAGDGQVFTSKNGDAELRVSGAPCVDETDFPTVFLKRYTDKEHQRKIRVTYRHKTRTSANVSGLRGTRIFYGKALFDNGSCSEFTLEYDPARRELYDKIAATIASSFKPFHEMPVPANKPR